jgi:hypothetical protein
MRLAAQDRRKEMAKLVSKLGEEGKVAIRCAKPGMHDHHVLFVHSATAKNDISSACHAFKQFTALNTHNVLAMSAACGACQRNCTCAALLFVTPWKRCKFERTP